VLPGDTGRYGEIWEMRASRSREEYSVGVELRGDIGRYGEIWEVRTSRSHEEYSGVELISLPV